MSLEKLDAADSLQVGMAGLVGFGEKALLQGHFAMQCFDKLDGELLWQEDFDNVVCTPAKNLNLDTFLAGSAYTVTGPFLGLISSASFSAVSAADTMASHAGWLEAGSANAPTFSGARQTAVYASASAGSKALSPALAFTMTGSGTVQGAFVVLGTGAVATLASTAGTLLSAGAFGTPQPVISGNVVTVSWSLAL